MAKVSHANFIFPSFSWSQQTTAILWVDHRHHQLHMHDELPSIKLHCANTFMFT